MIIKILLLILMFIMAVYGTSEMLDEDRTKTKTQLVCTALISIIYEIVCAYLILKGV